MKKGEGRAIAVPVRPFGEEVEVGHGRKAGLGEDVDADPGAVELFDYAAGDAEGGVEWLVGVTGETEKDL